MTQDDFNRAFSSQFDNLPSPFDPRELAERVIQRDTLWTKWLASLALLFWLTGTAGILLLILGLNRLIIYIRIARFARNPDDEATRLFWGTDFVHHSIPWVAGSVVALMLAGLFTVLLIIQTRRATLNRINFSIKQLAEHVKRLSLGEKS